MLCGLLPPNEGTAKVAGIGYEGDMKSKVGYMSQKFTLYNDLTVHENLDFIASLRKLDDAYYQKRRKELLELIGYQKGLDDRVQDLSGGTKQKVSLAAAMLHDPEVVFLDEPTAGVTPAGRALFWKLIRQVADSGKTVFVTTHYMDEAEQCGRIGLMRDGKLIAVDTPAGLKKTAFPEQVYEFDPLEPVPFSSLAAFEHHAAFSFFEPYGPRFHAAAVSAESWAQWEPRLREKFSVRPIAPSLEDVFIRLVERPR